MSEVQIKFIPGKASRGKWPVSLLAGDDVLLALEVNPHKPADVEAFITAAKAKIPGLDGQADELRRQILNLAKPVSAKSEIEKPAALAEPDHAAMFAAMPESARVEAERMLSAPDLMRLIVDDIAAIGVAGEKPLGATLYLLGTSRRLSKPLAAIIQGHSSTGKSYLPEKVAELFPGEAIIRANQMTPQSLFHMKPGELRNRWVVAGERSRVESDDRAEATRALREMLASGRLSKLMPMKGENGIETVLIEQEGPIAYSESTTAARIDDDDLNRCILLNTDERPEQTRRILRAQAANRASADRDVTDVALRHHAIQRLIAAEPAKVNIPFAPKLAELFPTDRPEARRAFGHTLSMIEASALLHHRQRQQTPSGMIEATVGDYRLVLHLLAGPMGRALGRSVSEGARRLADRLAGWVSGAFSSADTYKREQFTDRCIRGWLGELVGVGWLKINECARGKPTIYQIVDDAPDLEALSPLPSIELIFGDYVSAVPPEVKL